MTEEAPQPEAPATPEEPVSSELPSFNIYEEGPPESPAGSVEVEPPADADWKQRLAKDRAIRKRELALKQREKKFSNQLQHAERYEKSKAAITSDPIRFLEGQGVNTNDLYRNWTQKMINEGQTPSPDERIDKANSRIKQLEQQLQKRDRDAQQKEKNAQRNGLINSFYRKIEDFAVNNEGYDLVKERLTPADIADGMSAFYKETGKKLSLKDAFDKLEQGLKVEEKSFYSKPEQVAKFRKYANGEAPPRRRAQGTQATMTSQMVEQPTRDSTREMSYDEIREHWKGKLFT